MMLVLLLGIALLATGAYALRVLLFWSFPEEVDDGPEQIDRLRHDFYRPRTWAAFRRLIAQKPARLSYRRDSKGRFRKLG